jgi:hypothetical protein
MRREIEFFIEFTERFNYKEIEISVLSQSRISESCFSNVTDVPNL